MRREIEELKALVRGICANKDVEPSFDPNNVPTVDQYNTLRLVALSKKNNMECLIRQPCRSTVRSVSSIFSMKFMVDSCLLRLDELGWRAFPPIQCMGLHWGKGTCEFKLDTSMNKTSRGPSHVPDPAAGRKKNAKKSLEIKRSTLELSFMCQGNQIEVPIPYTIMGFEMPVFLSFDDIYEFINLQEISANCLLVYMRYLEELCWINGQAEKFVFVSPTLISPVRTDTEDVGMRERVDIIDPWEDLILYFDPVREKKRDDFTELMNMALTDWKIMTGEGIRRRRDCKTKISNRPCPLQEGSVEYGYFILGENGLAM
ncbi:hypothetical protein TIFTF001_017540 [Ficus carica]|uniref:Uncharacterized protein n=1 Tax=Ficus carica TaxID=3494 RepID=A0AA88D8F9_FICCA|nr:hypothetical protein TIFTF001_017540 [Ficus carica]